MVSLEDLLTRASPWPFSSLHFPGLTFTVVFVEMYLKCGCISYALDLSKCNDGKKLKQNSCTAPSYRQLLIEIGPVVPFGSLISSSDPVTSYVSWV